MKREYLIRGLDPGQSGDYWTVNWQGQDKVMVTISSVDWNGARRGSDGRVVMKVAYVQDEESGLFGEALDETLLNAPPLW